jgi:hypothetical protein
VSEENKAMVQRLVEVINAGDLEGTVDELFALQAARRVKRLFTEFYKGLPRLARGDRGTGRGGEHGGGTLQVLGHTGASSWATTPSSSHRSCRLCAS